MHDKVDPQFDDLKDRELSISDALYRWKKCIASNAYADIWEVVMIMSPFNTKKVAIKNVLIRPEDTASNIRNILAENEAYIHKTITSFKANYNILTSSINFKHKFTGTENTYYFFVFPLADGGYISSKTQDSRVSEIDVAALIKDVLNGLEWLHKGLGIIYADFKPSNIQYQRYSVWKVFLGGFSGAVDSNSDYDDLLDAILERSGDPKYLAPELMKPPSERRLNDKSALFSLGIICAELLLGFHPFISPENVESRKEYKVERNTDFSRFQRWNELSTEVRDFIEDLTKENPDDRMSLNDARYHEWVILPEKLEALSKSQKPLPGRKHESWNKRIFRTAHHNSVHEWEREEKKKAHDRNSGI